MIFESLGNAITGTLEEWRFDRTVDNLSCQILCGVADVDAAIVAMGKRFPNRDLRGEVDKIVLETRIRNDPEHYYSQLFK